MEPINLITYFLIVLVGFTAVWGFRWEKYKNLERTALDAFEYLAFSTIWGSVVLFLVAFAAYLFGWITEKNLVFVSEYPFMVSPGICFLGLIFGILAAKILKRKKGKK